MEWVPSPLATVAAWALIATFAWAAAAKSVNSVAWSSAVRHFGFRRWSGRVVALAVPLAELVIVIMFLSGNVRAAAASTLALVASFSGAIVRSRAIEKQDKVPCGCFGGSGRSDYRLLLTRNAGLAVLAGLILLAPRSTSVQLPNGTELVPTILVVVAGVLIVWMTMQAATTLRRR